MNQTLTPLKTDMNTNHETLDQTVVEENPQPAVATPRGRSVRRPRYRIDSTAEAHTVQVDLPGAVRESVKLVVDDGVLTLRAERATSVPSSWKSLHRELSEADYELRLRLNDRINGEALTASLEEGVLTVVLPVKEAARPRTIVIE